MLTKTPFGAIIKIFHTYKKMGFVVSETRNWLLFFSRQSALKEQVHFPGYSRHGGTLLKMRFFAVIGWDIHKICFLVSQSLNKKYKIEYDELRKNANELLSSHEFLFG